MVFDGLIDKIADFSIKEIVQGRSDFPEIALRMLSEFEYKLSQHEFDAMIANWMLANRNLPEQINLHNTFGEPPVTIYNNGEFVIDLYIWIGADTSIHSHGFRGAFRVLHGKSLHETYEVKVTGSITDDVELTKLTLVNVEILKAGDVRMIAPGRDLTHRVIHLEGPTVTLCVKTINEKSLAQWHHFTNGLAIQKRHLDQSLIKKIYYFQYLASREGTSSDQFLSEIIAQEDVSTLMNLCEALAMGSFDIDDDFVQLILEKIYLKFDGQEWFRRYQESVEQSSIETTFQNFESAEVRLRSHLQNLNLDLISSSKRDRLFKALEN